MADPNLDLDEFSRLMAQAHEELRMFGKITDETAAALRGTKQASDAMKTAGLKAADALGSLTNFALTTGATLQRGAKGATALAGSVDQLSSTVKNVTSGLLTMAGVFLMFSPAGRIGRMLATLGISSRAAGAGLAGLGVASAALTEGMTKLTQTALEQADALYLGYTQLAKVSGSAADGMGGVFDEAKALGLSFDELGEYSSTIAGNASELVLFGGQVRAGRRNLADMGLALEDSREGFLRMGIPMNDVVRGLIASARFQRIAGNSVIKTSADIDRMSLAAAKFIVEQDRLTKLTGLSADEQERVREQVLSQERFAAQIENLRQQNKTKEAKALLDTYTILYSQNKAAAQGFADVQTGFVDTEAARQSLLGTQSENAVVAQAILDGQLDGVQAAQRIAAAHGRTASELGTSLGLIGSYNQTFGDLTGDLRLRKMSEQDMVQVLQDAEKDREALLDKEGRAVDPMLAQQAKLYATQIKANEALNRFVDKAVLPAQQAMTGLVEATYLAGDMLNTVFGGAGAVPPGGVAAGRSPTAGMGAGARGRAPGAGAAPAAPSDILKGAAAKNLNPGNLRFAGQEGAVPGVKGFAAFESVDAGTLALAKQLDLYLSGRSNSGKLDTIESLISRYAPASDNNDTQAYIKSVSAFMGMAPDAKLGRDPKTIAKLMTAIIGKENQGNPAAGYAMREIVTQAVAQALGIKPGDVPKFAQGGITRGPSIAGEAGPEAVVPLPDGKTIPVTINLRDEIMKGETMPGVIGDGYLGYNRGPMTTDLEAVAKIAEKLGAYDAATQTITDPESWKRLFGLGMNFDFGVTQTGSKVFGPEIADVLAKAIKDTMQEDNVDVKTAIVEITKQFQDAQKLVYEAQSKIGFDQDLQREMIEGIRAMVKEQARTADASQRMAAIAAN